MSKVRIVHRPRAEIAPEQARDTRAAALAYVFNCFRRRVDEEGSSATAAPDNAERSSNEIGAESRVP